VNGGIVNNTTELARHYLIRGWMIFVIALYLLVFHVFWASRACLASVCLPPSPITPPSPDVVAWTDLVVGLMYLAVGVRALQLGTGARSR
jgi:hypothetical protein